MALNKDFILAALLRRNYFPAQRKAKDELPPVFTTAGFSNSVAAGVVAARQRRNPLGWDSVEYRATRFNGVPRLLSIPHPLAYASLAISLSDNWSKLRYTGKNTVSLVRPREHKDGRIIIMDYERSPEKHARCAALEFGKRFVTHTDIANFFPSIYSHAFPWAAVGVSRAKKKMGRSHAAEWFNQVDEKLRKNKRNETQGIAIGPATSNLIAESILARVDATLVAEGFDFIRYIDDYTAYCETEDKAQTFIRRLGEELATYKLLLNIKKTEVHALPLPREDSWVSELNLKLPKGNEISEFDAMSYLDFASALSKDVPDGSVLKYAIKALLNSKLKQGVDAKLVPQVLAHAYHQPALLPVLSLLLDRVWVPRRFRYSRQLRAIAAENVKYRRSDGTCWALYILIRNGGTINRPLATHILRAGDCCSVLLLYLAGGYEADVLRFARKLRKTDYYELDQYWLLLYELFFDARITNPYRDEDAFPFLKAQGVSFVNRAKLARRVASKRKAVLVRGTRARAAASGN